MKRVLLLLIFGIGIGLTGWGQQVIGSFPIMDGGFENQSSGALGNTLSSSAWSRQSGTGSTITTSGGRSGPKYVTSTVAASNRLLQSPQDPTAANGPAANTAYRVQFYYKSSAAFNVFQIGVTINGTSSPTYSTGATLASTSGVWTKFEGTVTTPSGTVTSAGIGIIRGGTSASGGPINVDDFVIYGGPLDNTAPTSPGTVTVNGATQTSLNVSWVAATGGVDGGGYVVVRYTSDPGTGNDPNQNGIYAVGNTVATGGTVRYIGTGISFTDNVGLSSGTQYWYNVYTVDKAFNYSDESAGNGTTTSPSGSTSSDIIGAGNETSNIAYTSYQASSITTTSDAVRVFSFTIRDGGGSADDDELPTILASITFDKGASNGVTNWANTIREAALFDGTTKISEVSVVGETIAFTGLSGSNVTASDGGNKTLDLYVTFESTVTDNQQFQVQVTNSNVTNAASGSSSFTTFTAVLSSVTVDANRIEVTATKLAFVQQPTSVAVNETISPPVTVAANDASNNRDLDYITDVLITASGATLTGSPVSATPSSGLATFNSLTLTTAGTGVSLNSTSGSLTDATSNTFDITQPPTAGEIVINQFNPGYSGASDEYIELLNKTNKTFDLALLKIEYQSASGGAGGAGGVLSGSLGPYQYWLLSPNATITIGQTSSLSRDGTIASGFGGASAQFALRLVSSPNIIIDGLAYGTITVNNLGEGTAIASPSSNSGYIRNPEGVDNNSNSSDFVAVTTSNIYLRNHNSLCVSATYTLPTVSYPADVVISGSSPAVTLSGSTSIAGKLTILSGSLTVASNQNLTVSGTLTNSAGASGLILESGASLLHNNDGVNATVKREIASDSKWHFISSPNSGIIMPAICDENFAPLTSNFNSTTGATYGFFKWSEATSVSGAVWNNLKNSDWSVNTTDFGNPPKFVKGIGYLVEYASGFSGSTTKSFVDSLANGSQNIPVTVTNNRFNLIGNPFCSAIDWKAAAGWTRSVLKTDGTNGGNNIWIWNGTEGNYGTYSTTNGTDVGTNGVGRYIAPTQAFFVQANTAGNIVLDNNVRVANIAGQLKSGEELSNSIRLSVNSNANTYSDEILIEFGHTSNDGGSGKWWSLYADAPSLYTVKNDKNYSISFLTDVAENQSVPVSFKAGVNGNYTLASTFDQSSFGSIKLQDLKTGVIQDLKTNPVYTFTANTGDDAARFILKFGSVGVNDLQVTETGIYSYNNQICIQNPGKATLEVYNMAGQRILVEEINSNGLYQTSLNNQTGYYVVRLTNAGQVKVSKVFIR